MRKSVLLVLFVLPVLTVTAPAQPKNAGVPYRVDFDRTKDIEQMNESPDGKKKGIFVKVRFSITLDGSKVDSVDKEYKLVIEEEGHRIMVVDMPRPTPSEDLSVMLAIDTSGSMKEHGRIEQARAAADVFLRKLPARADCGLILFDHEIRDTLAPIFKREPLMERIAVLQPRGGTAYLDAASNAIGILSGTPAGRDRALVLMTDGIDLNSEKTIQQVIAEAKKERVRVYPIGIGEPGKFEQVNSVLVLDHSGSMTPPADDFDTTSKIKALHLAAQRYLNSMSSVGRVAMIPFNSTVGKVQPFTSKSASVNLRRQILSLQPDGETALLDATYEAICLLEADSGRGKRAVIAMTDGKDNTSRRRVDEVIERARETGIPLYMLGFGRASDIDEAVMRQLADASGGKYYHAKNKDSLLEIFENLSIQLHDDGIEEATLKQIAKETGGQYYPAKNVTDLKFILEQVTKSIQRESYEIVFESKFPSADGTSRNVTLKMIRQGAGGVDEVVGKVGGSYQMRGLVVAEMNHVVYLILLLAIGGLIALPALLRRTPAA